MENVSEGVLGSSVVSVELDVRIGEKQVTARGTPLQTRCCVLKFSGDLSDKYKQSRGDELIEIVQHQILHHQIYCGCNPPAPMPNQTSYFVSYECDD